jgi:hypothetical protein
MRKNYPLVKGGDGAATVVAEPSGVVLKNWENQESMSRYSIAASIFELSSERQDNPIASFF